MSGMGERHWFGWGLGIATALAALVRVGYVLVHQRHEPLVGDAFFYHHGANLLLDGHGFIDPYAYLLSGDVQQAADHPPVFVTYLAAWSAVGLDSVTSHLVAGALLGTLGVLLIGLAGRRVGGPVVGVIAALFAALYPGLWGWDTMGLSEPAAVVGVGLTLITAWRMKETPSVRRAIELGAAIAFATMCRAELAVFGPLIVVPLVWRMVELELRRRVLLIAVCAATVIAGIAPWVAHNLTRFAEPVYLSAGLEVTLAYSNCDEVYQGRLLGYWEFTCATEVMGRAVDDPSELDQSERSAIWREETRAYMSDNIDRIPTVVLARIGRTTGLFRPLQQLELDIEPEGRDLWEARIGLGAYYALAGLSVLGWVALGRQKRLRYPLLVPVVTVLLSAAITWGSTRYRVASEPTLCILAAAGVVALLSAVQRRREPRPARSRSAEG